MSPKRLSEPHADSPYPVVRDLWHLQTYVVSRLYPNQASVRVFPQFCDAFRISIHDHDAFDIQTYEPMSQTDMSTEQLRDFTYTVR